MIYLALIILIFMLWMWYMLSKKELFSATTIQLVIGSVFVAVAISSMSFYDLDDLHWNTFFVFLLAFAFFGLGEWVGGQFGKKENTYVPVAKEHALPIWLFVLTLAGGAFVLYAGYVSFMDAARGYGLQGDLIEIFPTMRSLLTRGKVSVAKSTLISQGEVLLHCLSYLFFYCFVNNVVYGYKKRAWYLLALIPSLGIYILSTARVGFIKFFVVLAMIAFLTIKEKNGWSSKTNRKIIPLMVVFILVIGIFFRLAGMLTGKSQGVSLVENVYMYFSNALFCFDSFLNDTIEYSTFFGARTLRNLYSVLNAFGLEIPLAPQFSPSFPVGSSPVTDNILTGMYNPVLDYTVLGMLVQRLLLGVLYGVLISKMKHRDQKMSMTAMVFCGLAFYPIVMWVMDDLFGTLIDLSMIYMLVYLTCLKYIFLDEKWKKKQGKKQGK